MRTVIIGGGIAGLGAAYTLKKAAEKGADVTFTLLERSDRVGGQLWTDRVVDEKGREIVADGGSDSYLTSKGAIARVAGELGIGDKITGSNDANKKTFIVRNGGLVEMPDGIMMFAPTKIIPLATTSLYSWPAKFRMALDLVIPKKHQPESGMEDESLESLVTRRLGREALDRLAEAIIGGVNGSDPKTMSVLATYPSLLEMEQEHGSLIKGFLAQRKKVEEIKKKYPPKPGAKPRTFFSSFEQGLGTITDALAQAVGYDNIELNSEVLDVAYDGAIYTVTTTGGDTYQAESLIIASSAKIAGELLGDIDSKATTILDSIPHSSCATVVLAFDKKDAPFDKKWHGILTPAVENRRVTGISLVSSKWEGRCDDSLVLLRGFVGGPRDAQAVELSDDEMIELTTTSFVELLGLKPEAPLRYAKVFRFPESMPQYTVGHLDRMETLNTAINTHKGLALAGAAYTGVGVPNCLESGERAAEKVLSDFELTAESVKEDA